MLHQRINQFSLFKDLFPDYETFSNWYKSLPLSDSVNPCPSEKTFALIAYEYNESHCAYSDEGFLQHFAIDLYTYYPEFEASTKAIQDLMSLSDEDLAISGKQIINNADIPEAPSSTDEMTVDFISTQQKIIQEKGLMQVKREQLSNKRTFTTRTFIKRFKHLFRVVFDTPFVPVIEEDEED